MAWLLTAPAARAELDLKWDAPPGCPRGSDVLERIRALAGPSFDKTEGLSAEGNIAPAKGRFYLTLLVRDGADVRKRVIASDSCSDLEGAAAITLALLLGIDVSAAEGRPDAEPADPGAPPSAGAESKDRRTPADAVAAPRPAPSPDSAPRRHDFLLQAPVLVGDLGPLPRASLGAGLGGGVRVASWRFLLGARVYAEQTVDATDLSGEFGAGATLRRMSAHLTVCRGWRSAGFELAPCLGLALEHLSAEGFGQGVAPATPRAVWLAPNAGAAAYWYPLKSLALFTSVTGYLELARPRLVIDGLGEVGQLSPLAAGAAVGLEWIL